MRSISLEPNFSRRGTRAFVCGGMAGNLELHEKGWLGHKQTILHSGEGPIWKTSWRGALIVWANDTGVRIYDTGSSQRVAFLDRPANSPRADLFKCTLQWRDDTTLMIAWANYVKLVRIRPRPSASASTRFLIEVTAIFQVDCMISGIAPHASPPGSFLVLGYIAPDTFENEATSDRAEQRRKAAHRPELRIISRSGEELSSDVLGLTGYEHFGCNDYVLQPSFFGAQEESLDGIYVVTSPQNVVLVKPRDDVDHVGWLVDRLKYAEALAEIQRLEKTGSTHGLDAPEIGRKYIRHLIEEGRLSFDVFLMNSSLKLLYRRLRQSGSALS
jgi:vacuolar protein sorting-associated protein 41